MRTTRRVLKYELHNVVRSRAVLVYTVFLFLLTDVLFRFGGEGPRVVLSLLNVVLLFVPLVSVVFGTMYVYSAREFTELLLAQPVGRRSLFAGLYLGLALPLAGAFLAGVGLPFVIHARPEAALWGPLGMLLTAGLLLTFVFTAVAMLLATLFDDRAKGLGGAILIWLGCAILYDGLILLLITMFRDYPLERPVLVLTLLNPIDLGRVLLLLQFDTAALMGYTGAVFERFFGTAGDGSPCWWRSPSRPRCPCCWRGGCSGGRISRPGSAAEGLDPGPGGRRKGECGEQLRSPPRQHHPIRRSGTPPHPRQQDPRVHQDPRRPHRRLRPALRQPRILGQDPPRHSHGELHHPAHQHRLRMRMKEPEDPGGDGRGLAGEEQRAHRRAGGEPAERSPHEEHAEEGHPTSP